MGLIATVLILDFLAGALVRALTRRAAWSVLVCILIPPLTAVLPFGLDVLLHSRSGEQGMAHYYAVLGFTLLVLFGFAASAAGVVVSLFMKLRRAKTEDNQGQR